MNSPGLPPLLTITLILAYLVGLGGTFYALGQRLPRDRPNSLFWLALPMSLLWPFTAIGFAAYKLVR
jgi:hypothetical protein